jgi:hypothetical protein
MKTKSILGTMIAIAISLVTIMPVAGDVAAPNEAEARLVKNVQPRTPIGRRAFVTVAQTDVTVNATMADNNKRVTDPVVYNGIIILMTPDWIVLEDGTYEKWLPMSRVLLLSVSR